MQKYESELYLTRELEELAKKVVPSPEEKGDAWQDFKGAVKTIGQFFGGEYTDGGSLVFLESYQLENLKASFAVKLTSDQPRVTCYPSWGEFTRLEIGGIDWLRNETVNPRRARIFIQVFVCGYPRLNKALTNLQLSLQQRNKQAIFEQTLDSGDSWSECSVFWNPLLVSRLREMGEKVPDPSVPRIAIALPISIENLWTMMHELSHTAHPYELLVSYYLQDYELFKKGKRWKLDKTKVVEIRQAMARLEEEKEIEAQKLAFTRYLPILKAWGIQDYKQRFRDLDLYWRTEILARKLRSIEEKQIED